MSYNGRSYHGSQVQPGVPTVEGEIRRAFDECKIPVTHLALAGRTDSGVSAIALDACVTLDHKIECETLKLALNGRLPRDIRINNLSLVDDSFHSRGSARFREYRYFFSTDRVPVYLADRVLHISTRLDVETMRVAAHNILGVHDFSGFRCNGSKEKSVVKFVVQSDIKDLERRLVLEDRFFKFYQYVIVADSFVYRMVRNIVGALFEVGKHKLSIESFKDIINSGKATGRSICARPEGLSFVKVYY